MNLSSILLLGFFLVPLLLLVLLNDATHGLTDRLAVALVLLMQLVRLDADSGIASVAELESRVLGHKCVHDLAGEVGLFLGKQWALAEGPFAARGTLRQLASHMIARLERVDLLLMGELAEEDFALML